MFIVYSREITQTFPKLRITNPLFITLNRLCVAAGQVSYIIWIILILFARLQMAMFDIDYLKSVL